MKSVSGSHRPEDDSDRTDAENPGQTEPLYLYEPLAPGEIRVLVLLEADSFDDDLECGLLALPLVQLSGDDGDGGGCEPFTALSYVWGNDTEKKMVYFGDKTLCISANLDSALRHLRRRDRDILLWVDAICINQSDLSERNHQVQQMKEIYQCAHEVVAYLGDHDNGNVAHSAWNFLERSSTWALNEDLDPDCDVPRRRENEVHFRGDLYDVYHAVLTREWFQRVWVFQEAVVCKHLSIQSRHRRVPWDDFIKCTVLQKRVHDLYGQSLDQASGFDFVRQIWQARVSFHAVRGQSRYLPDWYAQHMDPVHDVSTDMLDMLVLARHRKASDPRDKVFALLGVSTGFDWQSKGTVDYGKTTTEVFQDFAIDYMLTSRDYRILSYLNRASRPRYFQWRTDRRPLASQGPGDDTIASHEGRVNHQEVSAQAAGEGAVFSDEHSAQQIVPEAEAWGNLAQEAWLQEQPSLSQRQPWVGDEEDDGDEEEEEEEEREAKSLHLPSWVANWDCSDQMDRVPRAIVEAVESARTSNPAVAGSEAASGGRADVESYRTWVDGLTTQGRVTPRATLAVQGRVLGKVASGMSPTFLLGKDESLFCALRARWMRAAGRHDFPLEAHILSLWTELLKHTWSVETLLMEDTGLLSPLRFRREIPALDLSANPYLRMMPHFDVETLPPRPGSIESYLVERAELSTDWSGNFMGSSRVVPSPRSIVDQRLLGLYRFSRLSPETNAPKPSSLADIFRARQVPDLGPEKLVLLPLEAKFGDLVVVLPGAKVPFLVRSEGVSSMQDQAAEKVHRGNLPRIETAKLRVDCRLVGECWVNGFEDMTREEQVFDTVFSIH